jgi:hypothetical protein
VSRPREANQEILFELLDGAVLAGDRGLPSGGTARQALRNKTGTDFDAEWVADPVMKFKAADETRSSTRWLTTRRSRST